MDVFQYGEIQNDIVTVLQAARNASARSANALMTATYWEIGRRIVEFEQGDSSGRNTESPSSSNSPKIWSHVLGGLWVAQPHADACVLPRVARLEDFADTVCKICPTS
jgi:hypothetical protein